MTNRSSNGLGPATGASYGPGPAKAGHYVRRGHVRRGHARHGQLRHSQLRYGARVGLYLQPAVRQTTQALTQARISLSYVVSGFSRTVSYVVSGFSRTVLYGLSAFRRPATISLIVLATAGVLAQENDRSKTEAQAQRATERLQALQREADQLAADERTVLNGLRALEVERRIKAEEFVRVSAEADAVAAEVASTTTRIDELEAQDVGQLPELRSRLVEIYKLGQARYLRLLLSTSDVRQIGRASRMVAALAQADRQRVVAHQQTVDALKAARVAQEASSRRLLALRHDAERAERAAAAATSARADLVREIDRRRDLNAQLAGELLSAQQKLQATLREFSTGTAVAEPSPLPIGAFRGALEWPVAGAVRRRFGSDPGTRSGQSNGIEIASAEGTAVMAVHEGTVAYADPFAGFGNLVIVDHGAQTFSLYGDLLDLAVKRGAHLERGQSVGTVGAAPTGPAGLYFELRIDGRPVDPLQRLKKR
jgi:murein hydrolase activator